ncbi:MAG: hypothetical protein Phog2KO_12910 [Phototrophicaceae bacterium]
MIDNNQTFPNKLRYRHLMVAVLLILFAFSLRIILIYHRAEADPSFVPELGRDHRFYIDSALGVLDGTFPVQPFWFHPGPSYIFAGIFALLNTDNFVLLTFVIALIDSLTCGFLIGSGWLLTKRAWGGYLTGAIYALYPVAIFYATTPLIAPLAAFFVSGFIFFTLWQGEKLSLWRSIIIGLFMGLIAINRLNLVPLADLYVLWLLMQAITWRQRILHSLIFMLMTATVIAPFTMINYRLSGGDFIPIATTGTTEIYMGNNRDSAGRHSLTFAFRNNDLPYNEALLRDIQVAPEHFIGLMTYKFASFWSGAEPGNNLTFDRARVNSSLLSVLPMRFSWLTVLGLLGLSVLWYRNKQQFIFLGFMVAWICFGYVLVFAFGRIRFPVVVPMTLLSGFSLVSLYNIITDRTSWEQAFKQYRLPLLAIIALMIFVNWTLYPSVKLPLERTYADLPPDAVRVDAQFGDVQLVGWRNLEQWNDIENGWIPVRKSYAVELFWQVTEPTDIIYNFFIAYIDEGQRYDAVDTPLGTVSFPYRETPHWRDNQIYGEIISLRLDEDIPQARSAQIRVGVWYWDTEGLIVNVPANNAEDNILIQTIAVFDENNIPPAPDLPPSDLVFGEQIALLGYDIASSASPDEVIPLVFAWEARQNITEDYRLFLHVVDDNGEIVTQGDNRPIPNLLSYNWMPNYPLSSELSLTMPSSAGTYSIYAGLYNNAGRLTVDAPDNRVLLGTISVE